MDAFDGLGTWTGWAGDPNQWPVSDGGRAAVEWAVEAHRSFFGDEWLAAMASSKQHPLMMPFDWPLRAPLPLVRLMERAARLSLLVESERQVLADESRRSSNVTDFHHLELLLEVIGLAARDGWTSRVGVPTPTGRCPDLRIESSGATFSVEVTRMEMDREMRATTTWCSHVSNHLQQLQLMHGVGVEAVAARVLDEKDTSTALDDAAEAIAATARDRMHRRLSTNGLDVRVSVSAQPSLRFIGPVTRKDGYTRLAIRLEEKAKQTIDGPEAWIRLDELGGLFTLTDWSRQDGRTQLAALKHNIQATLGGFSHIRGVILSGGTPLAFQTTPETWTVSDAVEAPRLGPALVVRRLPGSRTRRVFVIPVGTEQLVLHDQVQPEPVRWYEEEPTWLSWALPRLNQPPLMRILY